VQPRAHLLGRLVCKSNGQDSLWRYAVVQHKVCHPTGEYTGFAAARAGEDKNRAGMVLDRPTLFGVKVAQCLWGVSGRVVHGRDIPKIRGHCTGYRRFYNKRAR